MYSKCNPIKGGLYSLLALLFKSARLTLTQWFSTFLKMPLLCEAEKFLIAPSLEMKIVYLNNMYKISV